VQAQARMQARKPSRPEGKLIDRPRASGWCRLPPCRTGDTTGPRARRSSSSRCCSARAPWKCSSTCSPRLAERTISGDVAQRSTHRAASSVNAGSNPAVSHHPPTTSGVVAPSSRSTVPSLVARGESIPRNVAQRLSRSITGNVAQWLSRLGLIIPEDVSSNLAVPHDSPAATRSSTRVLGTVAEWSTRRHANPEDASSNLAGTHHPTLGAVAQWSSHQLCKLEDIRSNRIAPQPLRLDHLIPGFVAQWLSRQLYTLEDTRSNRVEPQPFPGNVAQRLSRRIC
jgi:hypothetical protein